MKKKIAIVFSPYYEKVVTGLKSGALKYLKEKKIDEKDIDFFCAPGAFEIPLLSKKTAQTKSYAGVICLGCVTKGETAHFEYISQAVTTGLMQAMLEVEVPMAYGILTTYTEEQALARSQKDAHNKGYEAARACLAMVETLNSMGKTSN